MPIIYFEGPPITKEQKAKLVREFTNTASETLDMPKETFTVLLKEVAPENVGVGGELLSERVKK